MPRPSLRLLHTSDVHLGCHGYGNAPAHHRHCVCPLTAIDALARQHEVDGVIVAGDLFDHGRVDEVLVGRAFGALAGFPGFSVLIAGNHDVHDDTSLYRRHRDALEGSGAVFFDDLEGATHTVADGALVMWARAMDEHSSKYRPLHGVPARPEDPDTWYLVLGHGLHIGGDSVDDVARSSLITSADIAATEADYVALGHHHVLTDVSAGGVTAFYSGAPAGYPGGQALLVELDPVAGVRTTALDVERPADCPDER